MQRTELISEINKAGVVVAGGLHPDLKAKYFRVGHMGSVSEHDHLIQTIGAIEKALLQMGYNFVEGSGIECCTACIEQIGLNISCSYNMARADVRKS